MSQRKFFGNVESIFDSAMAHIAGFGLEGLIYYTPVPFTPDGKLVPPTIAIMRNMPNDMETLWFDEGLHVQDPAPALALRSIEPLYWSHHFDQSSVLNHDTQGVVANYLRDTHRARGLTVPVQTSSSGCATVTGFLGDAADTRIPENTFVAEFMLFAHKLHGLLLLEAKNEDFQTLPYGSYSGISLRTKCC